MKVLKTENKFGNGNNTDELLQKATIISQAAGFRAFLWIYVTMLFLLSGPFALEAGRLGFILSRVQPKTLKLVSAVTLAKRLAIKCSAEDEMNRE